MTITQSSMHNRMDSVELEGQNIVFKIDYYDNRLRPARPTHPIPPVNQRGSDAESR
ncbi:MAG: hypothetical protein JO314_12105 [Acidobacteria bacterium]|nr:hypothetical protein [Acidobacteriota bacterium]